MYTLWRLYSFIMLFYVGLKWLYTVDYKRSCGFLLFSLIEWTVDESRAARGNYLRWYIACITRFLSSEAGFLMHTDAKRIFPPPTQPKIVSFDVLSVYKFCKKVISIDETTDCYSFGLCSKTGITNMMLKKKRYNTYSVISNWLALLCKDSWMNLNYGDTISKSFCNK